MMKYCKSCKLDIYEHHEFCPLCKSSLGAPSDSIYQYPEYTDLVLSRFLKAREISRKVIYSIIIVSLFLNIMFLDQLTHLYFLPFSMFLLYLFTLVFDTLNMSRRLGRRIINNYMMLSLLFVSVDVGLGYTGWSFEYALPLLSIMVSILSLMNLMIYEKEYEDSITYILAMIVFNVLPILLWIILGLDVLWPSIASLSVSIVIVLLMILFTRKQFASEIKKRIHT